MPRRSGPRPSRLCGASSFGALRPHHARIGAVTCQQVGMAAGLNQAAGPQHMDAVGRAMVESRCAITIRVLRPARPPAPAAPHARSRVSSAEVASSKIQIGASFVERAGDGQALALAARELCCRWRRWASPGPGRVSTKSHRCSLESSLPAAPRRAFGRRRRCQPPRHRRARCPATRQRTGGAGRASQLLDVLAIETDGPAIGWSKPSSKWMTELCRRPRHRRGRWSGRRRSAA